MNSEFLLSVLAIISILTSLTVEAIKKLLNEREIKYSANLLAAIVAVILTVVVSICYVIYMNLAVTPQIIITVIAMMFLSFLGSTVSFDKIKQLLLQIHF